MPFRSSSSGPALPTPLSVARISRCLGSVTRALRTVLDPVPRNSFARFVLATTFDAFVCATAEFRSGRLMGMLRFHRPEMSVSYPAARTRAREASFGRFRGRCLGRQPKTGVVLRRLLDLPRLPARRALRTAVPLLLILRTGGGTGTTFTSAATTASVYSKPPRASISFGHHMYPNGGIDCSATERRSG